LDAPPIVTPLALLEDGGWAARSSSPDFFRRFCVFRYCLIAKKGYSMC